MDFITLMEEMWGVDARGVEPPDGIINSYYLQEKLAKELALQNKVTNPDKIGAMFAR